MRRNGWDFAGLRPGTALCRGGGRGHLRSGAGLLDMGCAVELSWEVILLSMSPSPTHVHVKTLILSAFCWEIHLFICQSAVHGSLRNCCNAVPVWFRLIPKAKMTISTTAESKELLKSRYTFFDWKPPGHDQLQSQDPKIPNVFHDLSPKKVRFALMGAAGAWVGRGYPSPKLFRGTKANKTPARIRCHFLVFSFKLVNRTDGPLANASCSDCLL